MRFQAILFCAVLTGLLVSVVSLGDALIGNPFYPSQIESTKGDFIFFSNKVFSDRTFKEQYFDEIKNYKVCLTNGYEVFAGEDLEELHKAGCELFIYRWFNGFYEKNLQPDSDVYMQKFPFMARLFKEVYSQPGWILNPEQPMQGSGAVYPAYFFDYTNAEFRKHFAESIKQRLDETGYDGVFFDYIGSWALPAEVKALWKEKYPETSYDTAGIQFLKELREVIGQKRIFGNQTYRLEDGYFETIDYDLSESHGTSFVWGKEAEIYLEGDGLMKITETFYRGWDDSPQAMGYKNIAKEKIDKAQRFPSVSIFDANYLQPWYIPTGDYAEVGDLRMPVYTKRTDRPAIFYGYVLSKLHNGYGHASDWYAVGYGQDDLYYLNLGEPVDEEIHEGEDTVARYFTNGIAVITRNNRQVTFEPDERYVPNDIHGLWDVYEGTPVWNWSDGRQIEIYPAYYPATQSYYPSGRVYMFLRNEQTDHSCK